MPTGIERAEEIWNPITGCTKVSEGCRNCHAERMANRLRGQCGYPKDDPFRVTLHQERLSQPLHWRKPRLVFVSSMGDLFHLDVPEGFIDTVVSVMVSAPQHRFLLLTKRPFRMRYLFGMLARDTFGENFARLTQHIWLGVSVEDQKTADERIPILLNTPAAHRFVSVEPMLGPVELCDGTGGLGYYNWLEGYDTEPEHASDCDGTCRNCPVPVRVEIPRIEWVICGGETGPGARLMRSEWVRVLRDDCREAGVPFFLKQWGTERPDDALLWGKPEAHRLQEWPQELMRKRGQGGK